MGKKIFFIFFVLIVIGSATLLNQYAPVPVTNTQPNTINLTNQLNDQVPATAKNVTITSFPPDALVFLDNTQVGKTPVTLAQLTHTSYQLRVEKVGYIIYSSTLLPNESNGLVEVTLSPNTSTDPLITGPITIDDSNVQNLLNNDPQIPTALLGLVSVPTGYRFPVENQDITQRINLELIPPPTNVALEGIVRSELIARLATQYYYDPQSISIQLDNSLIPTNIVLFNGESYDPAKNKITSGETTIWYNHSSNTCQLRTDPQSPIKINQLIPAQKAYPMTLTEKGIYIFYCQGQPGPTHTLVVS